jgi:hypothetical protein
MGEDQIRQLKDILMEIYQEKDKSFSGLGLIAYSDVNNIPVSPLRIELPMGLTLPLTGPENIAKTLIELCVKKSFYHDGFHLLFQAKQLTHICQYFSPPIQPDILIDYSKGGRFRAAQYGSCLKNVLATGVIGETSRPYIFINGKPYEV